MAQIEYSFEEIALSLGKTKDGKQQNIALITGTATINVYGRGRDTEWEIESVTIEGPLVNDPDIEIERGHALYDFTVSSIENQCGDKIWDEANEASMPDPDYAREERAERRYQQMREERLGQS